MATTASAESLIGLVRRFNRFYTRVIGILARGYLETPYNLQQARVIYEIATSPGATAKDVRARTGFDQGYLSRLLVRLAGAGLVRKVQSGDDGRLQRLLLTRAGRRAFGTLDDRANDQVRGLLDPLTEGERENLATALTTVHGLLDPTSRANRTRIRRQRVGDLGWILHRQAVVYKAEFRYGDEFETYLCEGLPPYVKNYDPERDRLWVAEVDGRPVGFIAIHHVGDRPRWAKLRWFLVEKEARGRGLGSRLLKTAIAFCRRAGYEGVFLWTVSDLDAARRLYETERFLLAEETKGCAWAPWAREQRWELRLTRKAH